MGGPAVRRLLAVSITLVVVLAALALTLTGWSLFKEHYCLHLDVRPMDVHLIDGPHFLSPITLQCSYGVSGSVDVRDIRPLVFATAIAGVALLVILHAWYWTVLRAGDGSGNRARAVGTLRE